MGKGRKVNWQVVFDGQDERFQFATMSKGGNFWFLEVNANISWEAPSGHRDELKLPPQSQRLLEEETSTAQEACVIRGSRVPGHYEPWTCSPLLSGLHSSPVVEPWLPGLAPLLFGNGGDTDSSPFHPLTRVCWVPTMSLCVRHCPVWHTDHRGPWRVHSLAGEEGEHTGSQGNIAQYNQVLNHGGQKVGIPKWKRGNGGWLSFFLYFSVFSKFSTMYRYYFHNQGKLTLRKKEGSQRGLER